MTSKTARELRVGDRVNYLGAERTVASVTDAPESDRLIVAWKRGLGAAIVSPWMAFEVHARP
jgi:hypothetical protein